MSAYLIYDVDIHDTAAYGSFMDQVKPLVEAFGGRYLARGGAHEVLEGDWALTRRGWFCSNFRTRTAHGGCSIARTTRRSRRCGSPVQPAMW